MNVGELFAGIGGFSLGFERAGFDTLWQVEREPYRRAFLAQHFPDAERFDDVREVGAHNLELVDVVAGGFPCGDLSIAGRRAGLVGAKSGLWSELARVVRELRPRYVVVENVPSLLVRGMGTVVGDLAASGYDTEWDCLPAAAFGAPHLRARLWLLAYPGGGRHGAPSQPLLAGRELPEPDHWWANEPDVARVAHGVPDGVAKRRALGDSLVPQIAEWIGRRILEAEQLKDAA